MNETKTTTDTRYHEVRFRYDPRRDLVWKEIIRYLKGVFDFGDSVLDVGCGYGEFINNASCPKRAAVDLNPQVGTYLDSGVVFHAIDVLSIDHIFPKESFSLVFSSNLVEHLDRDDIGRLFDILYALVRPGGHVAILMPNYRLTSERYFDDYTHRTPVSDVALTDWLASTGLSPIFVDPAFLPFSLNGYRFAIPRFFIRAWFLSPWRPRAGQMLVVARRPTTPELKHVEK